MMRVLIAGVRHHKCDWCRRDFTTEQASHLTIEVGERSGLATLRGVLPGWRFMRMFVPQQLHFCIPVESTQRSCLDQWQRAVIGSARPPEYVR